MHAIVMKKYYVSGQDDNNPAFNHPFATFIDISDAKVTTLTFEICCNNYAKQKHLGCKKSARPIRSNMQAGSSLNEIQ